MTFTITLAWWIIPTAITILGILWAFFWPADRDGMFGGLTTIFMLIPALAVIAFSWVVAGILK